MSGTVQAGSVMQDVVFAVRSMRRIPAFTITALAALAIGIGANSAIFSVVDSVLLKPLAYPDSDRIVYFFATSPAGPVYGGSAAKFNIWRRQTGVFQEVSAYEYNGAQLNLTGETFPEQVHGIRVSANYFRLFGAPVVQGRTFTEQEDSPGGSHVVVLSYGLWQRRFGGDPQLAGKTILLGGSPYTVIGILGRDFNTELDSPPDLWLPFQIDPSSSDQAHYFTVVARLKPGLSLSMANARLQLAASEFHSRFPKIMGPRDGFSALPFRDGIVSDIRPSLVALGGAVGFVLLIACANVANLLLARGAGRKREIAIRAALGANRARIIRQLLVESVVLSGAGAALGLVLGIAGVRALMAVNTAGIPRLGVHGSAMTLDWRLFVFAVSITLLTGVLFGLIPALDVSRTDVVEGMKEGGERSAAGVRQAKTRALLVIGEVAMAVVLLIGAALLIRTFISLRAVNPGFDPHKVLTMRMSLAGTRFARTSDVERLIGMGVERIRGLPGVEYAAAGYNLPLEGAFGVPFNIVGREPAGGRYDGRGWMAVSPGYFDVFRIPLLRGRLFRERDTARSAPVALINYAMAQRFWPHGDPLHDRVILGKGYGAEFEEQARQIVGVVGDTRDSGLNHSPTPVVYVPMAQVTDGITALVTRASSLVWMVRTRVEPHTLAPPVQNELRMVTSGLPVAQVRAMDEVVNASTARASFNMLLLTVFASAALMLAAIGIYGVMAYSVRRRMRELGICLALGASPEHLRNSIVLQGILLASIGVALGLAASLGLTRFIASFLFGVEQRDPIVFTTIPALLLSVALLAAWIPAVRVTRIDPAGAMRSE